MAKKRDFSGLGKSILSKNEKPSSLSDFIGIEKSNEIKDLNSGSIREEFQEQPIVKNKDHIIRECISISKSDADMVNELTIKCAAEGQKTTKADVYRAAIRSFSKLSPAVMASKIREVRKDKKTHN